MFWEGSLRPRGVRLYLIPSLLLLFISASARPSLTGLVALTISTPSSTVPMNGVRNFYAVGRFSDGTTRDVTNEVSWYSADEGIGGFLTASPGLFHARAVGNANVWAIGTGIRSNDLIARVVNGSVGTVTGSVYSQAGAGLSNLTVGFYQTGSLAGSAQTGAGGAYSISLPFGTYEVWVTIPSAYPGYPAGRLRISAALPIQGDIVFNIILPNPYRLSGTVRNRSGSAIAGVALSIDDRDGGNAEYISGAVTTGPAGTYEFLAFGDTYGIVLAPPSLYIPVSDEVGVFADKTKDFVLDNTAHFYGTLRDRLGAVAANVDLYLIDWGTGASYGPLRTNASGAYDFRVPPGTYRFRAETRYSLPAGIPIGLTDVLSTVSISGETNRDGVLPTWSISGTLRDDSGAAIAGASIWASDLSGGPVDYGTGAAVSDAAGAFSLLLFQDAYYLTIGLPASDPRYSGMSPAARTRILTLDTAAADPGDGSYSRASYSVAVTIATPLRLTVTGTVRDARGVPITNATVSFVEVATGYTTDSPATDGGGSYGASLTNGTYKVLIATTNAAGATFPRGPWVYIGNFPITTNAALNFVVPEVHVRGTVLGTGDVPLSGVAVNLSDQGGTGGLLDALAAVTGADGRFDFLAFPDDLYYVSAVPPGGSGYFSEGLQLNAQGDVDITIRLQRPVTLTGRVTCDTPAVPGAAVKILQNGSVFYTATTDASGNYAIANIYPRTDYALEVRTAGTTLPAGRVTARATLSLLADTTIDIALPGVATVSGRVSDPAGDPVAGTGIRAFRMAPLSFSYDADPAAVANGTGDYSLRVFQGTYDFSATPLAGTNLLAKVETSVVITADRTLDFLLPSMLFVTSSGLAPVENLSVAALCPGNQAELTWDRSPSAEAFAYDIYSDGGTGILDWSNVVGTIAEDGSGRYTFRSAPLPTGHDFLFAVLVRDSQGRRSADLNAVVRLTPCGGADAVVRAVITNPPSGIRVLREEARIAAQLQIGLPEDVAFVTFEFRPFTSGSPLPWRSMEVIAPSSSPNPDPTPTGAGSGQGTYFVHWDIQAVEPGHTPVATGLYEIRARATGRNSGFTDQNAPSLLVQVVDSNPSYRESRGRDTHAVEYVARNDRTENRIEIAASGDRATRVVSLPGSALITPDATLRAEIRPSRTDPEGRRPVGAGLDISLSNGQTSLGAPATIEFPYTDADNDGYTDDSHLAVSSLSVYYFDEDSGVYRAVDGVTRDSSAQTITARTTHFTHFGLLGGGDSGTGSAASGHSLSFFPGGASTGCAFLRAGLPSRGVDFLRAARDQALALPVLRLFVSSYYGGGLFLAAFGGLFFLLAHRPLRTRR